MAANIKIEEPEDPLENLLEINIETHNIKIEPDSIEIKKEIKTEPNNDTIMSTEKNKSKIKCKTCSKIFLRTSLARHQKRCNIERPKKIKLLHSCDICEMRFGKKSEMYSHRDIEHRDAPAIPNRKNVPKKVISYIYPCEICKIDFEKKFELLQHWGKEHKDQEPLDRVSAIAFENKIVINSAEENPHQCSICGASYKRERDLLRHYTVHDNNGVDPFEGNPFSNDQSSSDIESNVFDLDLFRNQGKVLELFDNCRHFGNDGNVSYECKSCLQKFRTGLEFIEDQISHSSESNVKIDLEDPDLIRALEILDDSKIIKENQTVTHKCQTCQMEILTEVDFIEHQKTHLDERKSEKNHLGNKKEVILKILNDSKFVDDNGKVSYKCNICSKEFLIEDWFVRHYKLHSGGVQINFGKNETQSFPCDVCSKVFTRKTYMFIHRERFHKIAAPLKRVDIWKKYQIENDGNKKCWKCDFCEKIFTNRIRFRNHHELHTKSADELKRFICEICAKTFRLKCTLRKHMRTHDSARNYTCDICGSAFKNTEDFKQHMNIHTNNRPYKCDICSKSFRQKSSLWIHKKHMHSNEHKFFCNLCDFKTHRSYVLKLHSLVHTGEKPYVCSVCGEAFRVMNSLKRHMYTHKKEKIPCEICGEIFTQPRYLQRHIRAKHRGLENKN